MICCALESIKDMTNIQVDNFISFSSVPFFVFTLWDLLHNDHRNKSHIVNTKKETN